MGAKSKLGLRVQRKIPGAVVPMGTVEMAAAVAVGAALGAPTRTVADPAGTKSINFFVQMENMQWQNGSPAR
jgi:hypothetical protein